MRILVVEDYAPLRKAVCQGLREAGYAVDSTGDGVEGLWYAQSNDYDAIILDVMIPGIDGLTVLERLRVGGRPTHVLILTAKTTVEDRVHGLNLGADDYLVKPFVLEELLARVRALVRRRYEAKDPVIRIADLAAIGGALGVPVFRSVALPDGRAGRAAGVRFIPREERRGRPKAQEATLVLGRETREVDKTLARLRALLAGVGAGAILASVGLLACVVRRGLQPVRELASQIAGVGENGLSARIAGGSAPSELLPVVQRLNDLLARLERAFNREKAFSADVAHELRTPLAGLRATVEVALSMQRESSAYREALGDCLGICVPMQAMVDNLLALARADAGQVDLVAEPVGLDGLLTECWDPLAARAAERRLRVEWAVDPAVGLQTDRSTLRLILQNLLDNAVVYADSGGLVRVESRDRGGRIELIVANSGSKLSPEQAGHVFERFWRGDAARSDTGLHCGLGLALCQRLISLLGGSISVQSAVGGMFTVTLGF